MRNYYLRLLVAFFCCLSLVQNAWSDNDDREEVSVPLEKGRFYQANVFGKKPKGCSVVYSADASVMQRTWSSTDFRQINDVYTTGSYSENKIYSAVSPTIHIPSISYSDRLFVCLEEMFEVESGYDYVWIDVTTDGGDVWHRLYGKCGYTEGMVIDYLDASFLSGKDVKFKVSLKSDSLYTAAGWDIKMFEVLFYDRSEQNKNIERESELRSARMPKPVTRGIPGENGGEEGDSGKNNQTATVSVDNLKIINVAWENQEEGIISFSAMKNVNGKNEYIQPGTLSTEQIVVTIKDGSGKEVSKIPSSCLSFEENEEQRSVDIVLIVDYSGSMSSYINALNTSVKEMLKTIDEIYDIRFALLRFGTTASETSKLKKYKDLDYFYDELIWSVGNKGEYFYNYKTLEPLFDSIVGGSRERAYQAILHALSLPKYRNNVSKVFILLYDYDNDTKANTCDGSSCKEEILSEETVKTALSGTQLFAIVNKKTQNEGWFKDLCESSGGGFYQTLTSGGEIGDISTQIGDNLSNQFFLKIDLTCVDDNKKMECGKNYNVSVSISNPDETTITDDYLSTFIYVGDIKRDRETIEYDNTCLKIEDSQVDQSLKVKFSVPGGCSDDLYDEAYVYYQNSTEEKESPLKAERLTSKEPVYEVSLPIDKNASYLQYRIEVMPNKSKDSNGHLITSNLMSPVSGEESEGYSYWKVNFCEENPVIISDSEFYLCEEDNKMTVYVTISQLADDGVSTQPINGGTLKLDYCGAKDLNEIPSKYKEVVMEKSEPTRYYADLLCEKDVLALDYYITYEKNGKVLSQKGNGIDNFPRIKRDAWEKICVDQCNNIQLSSHIIDEENDLLSFDVYRKNSKVEIFLCDTNGVKLKSEKLENLQVGSQEVNLITTLKLRDNFNVEDKEIQLKFTCPYILVLKIDGKVSYMYVYLGRKKDKE